MRLSPWLGVFLGFGLAHGAAAIAAETITLTPPSDVIAGIPFSLGVATTSDVTSSTTLRVFIRPDDGRPCEASAGATNASVPKPMEVYGERRRADPVTIDVQAQETVGALRVCAFVELVAAPQTTLSRQDLVIGIRAPRGTLQLTLSTAAPYVGQTFKARVLGSTEALAGGVVTNTHRGPCGALPAGAIGGEELASGAFEVRQDVTIVAPVPVLPDRVCSWLTTSALGGVVLATAERPIAPRYDGSLTVIRKRFIKLHRKRRVVGWVVQIKARTSGKAGGLEVRIIRGGSCQDGSLNLSHGTYDWRCLLKHPPRRPFVVGVTYLTGLNVKRSVPNVTIAVPKRPSRRS